MIAPMTLMQVADFCRESLSANLKNGDAIFSRVNTDTRSLVAGELFVALRGENFDAHDFLTQAAEKNVCGMVVEVFNSNIALPQLIVTDTVLALGKIAEMNRNAFSGHLLAITGSSGKTTVKTMLAQILRECGEVLATWGNFNNHIGVPLTLLQIEKQHEYAVIEMGASGIGEIHYLCSLAKPAVSMVNNVMPAHIQGFGSIEGVAQAKGEIYQQLPSHGSAVINIDDKFSSQWLAQVKTKIITVSLTNPTANCFAKNIAVTANSVEFNLSLNLHEINIRLNSMGEHSIRNALMAAAMAFAVGASLAQIKSGLEKFSPVIGRMSSHTGVNQSVIIDDSYNANPGSVRAAIDVLAATTGQRILVLGDLAELGDNAATLHAELGIYAQHKIDRFFTLGNLSRYASDAFGTSQHFTERGPLIETLKKLATPNTTILIKGSRSAKMDLVVSALCQTEEQQVDKQLEKNNVNKNYAEDAHRGDNH
ncbi:MAG: UDP-N-acetylmuramoyl-tripeptide--D-alanyl-D-alanine ligase [Pseudomonadota bacterium]